MPNNILLSGPAGADKSAEARRLLAENPGLTIAADFQSMYVAITLAQRDPSGRYPLRDERLLPIVEYLRRAVFSAAQDRGISVIATNSDGNRGRRAFLVEQLGPDGTERIVDPGEAAVPARLADPITGVLSPECEKAIARWFRRVER